jgi:carbon storage regulator CsrA
MLVLSRRHGERLILECEDGTRIEIHLVAMGMNKVRLGVEAPPSVRVARGELADGWTPRRPKEAQ